MAYEHSATSMFAEYKLISKEFTIYTPDLPGLSADLIHGMPDPTISPVAINLLKKTKLINKWINAWMGG